jgi:hypothetical protein
MFLRVLVDGGAKLGWRLLTSDEVVENSDKLAKYDVHQRKEDSRSNHTDDCYCSRDPAYGIIVHEDALDIVSQMARVSFLCRCFGLTTKLFLEDSFGDFSWMSKE